MASQLRGKLEEEVSRSFHHGETHNTIHFEDFYYWLNEFRKNNSNINSLTNNNQCTNMEETKEPPSFVGGETEKELHYEDRKSLPNEYKKDEETLHEYEEVYIENIEYHFETHPTLEMKQRGSNDGCLNYEGLPTDGCSHLYVGDIEINF